MRSPASLITASVRAAASSIDIDSRVAQWRTAGYTSYNRGAPAYTADEIAAERKAFPVVQESLEVGKRADVIHANNVLAHVADLNGIVRGFRSLLKEDGVVTQLWVESNPGGVDVSGSDKVLKAL